jgi:predicted DNA-binding transcriptional regulator AlpA
MTIPQSDSVFAAPAAERKGRRRKQLAKKKRERERKHIDALRAGLAERLLDKHEVMAATGTSYPTIWAWMRKGVFPRSRIVAGRSMWLASEVNAWIRELKVRPLKGDAARAAQT